MRKLQGISTCYATFQISIDIVKSAEDKEDALKRLLKAAKSIRVNNMSEMKEYLIRWLNINIYD